MEKHIKKIYYIFIAFFVLFWCVFLFFDIKKDNTTEVVDLTWDTVELVDNGTNAKIVGNSALSIGYGQRVMFYSYRLNADIYINDRLVYHDTGKEIGWGSFVSDGIAPEDRIVIELREESEYTPKRAYQMFLDSICVGNKYDLMTGELQENMPRILVCCVMFIVGVGVLMASLGVFAIGIKPVAGGISCGLLIIVGAVTTFIDYTYITLMIPKYELIHMIDKASQGLICVLLMIYLKSYIVTKQHYILINLFIVAGFVFTGTFMVMRLCNFTQDGVFESTVVPIFIILILIEFAMMVMDSVENDKKKIKPVMYSTIFLAAATLIELMHYYVTNIFWINLFIVGLVVFSFTQVYVIILRFREVAHESMRVGQLESELVRQQVSMMLSQIQPHFLFNAMTSIRALCDEDPQSAKSALTDLAVYLRGNMDSLTSSTPITFEKEVEHLESYLALERIRFEERLNVNYQIQEDRFKLPALTIQPLVENAVKYGVASRPEGGTVTICTYRNEQGVVIEVSDDGVGVDATSIEEIPKKQDGRSHVGLQNVKSRVQDMCGGTLDFRSQKGVGTTVTVLIPNVDGDGLT